ncbi:MAG: hypothetical protein ACJAQT_004192 [Akkermansiaceae bacterium]|jgi:hypothetical protein
MMACGKEDPAEHWAFQPLIEPAVPEVRDASWPRTPIDAFILARLEAQGLHPAPQTDPPTLRRRATYNLTGLPPAFDPDATKAFSEPEIEGLLASPHFGERWARHWLDVARYSDTKGYAYASEEFTFVHSWVYRDWVVRAFNEDLPYDRFLMLQLAADRLLARDECSPADLAAMGYLTLGGRFIGVRQDIIDDRIDVVTRGMLGLTVSCARCHDHKFDPIPAADYYSLYGILNSSREHMVPLSQNDDAELTKRRVALETQFEQAAQEAEARFLDRVSEYLIAALDISKVPKPNFTEIISKDDLIPEQVRRWYQYLAQSDKARNPVFGAWYALAGLPPEAFADGAARRLVESLENVDPLVSAALTQATPGGMEDVARCYAELLKNHASNPVIAEVLNGPGSPIAIPRCHLHDIEWLFDEATKTGLKGLFANVERRIIELGELAPHAVAMEDAPVPQNARILLRGDYSTQGDEVPRRALAILGAADFKDGSGRLELAQSIASRDNPLTARVIVNRIWQDHFGTGLVDTASDFGLRTAPPSHPELLDFLAFRLIENGWSLKALHRMIVSSAVYQQSSTPTPEAQQVDPDNRLLSYFQRRRLDFEAMRDSLLAASGELDLSIGGQPGSLFGADASARRSLYGRIDRQFLPSTLRDFDFANPELHSAQRHETNVPQQALFFLNSPFIEARAIALAARVAADSESEQRIRSIFQCALRREPSEAELASSEGFISAALAADSVEAPTKPALAIPSAWSYGFGEYDEASGRLANFTSLPHFSGDAWGGGAQWPDAQLGWVRLTAVGGHVGNDPAHAAVRRWTAPVDARIRICGTIGMTDAGGDGVRALVISDRGGVLGSWTVEFGNSVAADLDVMEVSAGECIDFVVDCRPAGDISFDQFTWAPTILQVDGQDGEVGGWSAEREFAGIPTEPAHQLTAWERLAHTLLLSNAFIFVD